MGDARFISLQQIAAEKRINTLFRHAASTKTFESISIPLPFRSLACKRKIKKGFVSAVVFWGDA
jgi:hypothetical protein